jgi:hypothetical protein
MDGTIHPWINVEQRLLPTASFTNNTLIGHGCGAGIPKIVNNVVGIGDTGPLAHATSHSIYIGNERTSNKIQLGGLSFERKVCMVCQDCGWCVLWKSNFNCKSDSDVKNADAGVEKMSLCFDCMFNASLAHYASCSYANNAPTNRKHSE